MQQRQSKSLESCQARHEGLVGRVDSPVDSFSAWRTPWLLFLSAGEIVPGAFCY